MTIDRRAVLGATAVALAGGAAVNLAAIAAAKASGNPASDKLSFAVDPIFALIERHREARVAYHADLENDDLHDEERDAMIAVLQTPPTTLAGCAAALRYVAEACERDAEAALFSQWIDPWCSAGAAFPRLISEAIGRMLVQS